MNKKINPNATDIGKSREFIHIDPIKTKTFIPVELFREQYWEITSNGLTTSKNKEDEDLDFETISIRNSLCIYLQSHKANDFSFMFHPIDFFEYYGIDVDKNTNFIKSNFYQQYLLAFKWLVEHNYIKLNKNAEDIKLRDRFMVILNISEFSYPYLINRKTIMITFEEINKIKNLQLINYSTRLKLLNVYCYLKSLMSLKTYDGTYISVVRISTTALAKNLSLSIPTIEKYIRFMKNIGLIISRKGRITKEDGVFCHHPNIYTHCMQDDPEETLSIAEEALYGYSGNAEFDNIQDENFKSYSSEIETYLNDYDCMSDPNYEPHAHLN